MQLFKIELQPYFVEGSFAYIMVLNLELNSLKIFNQSEDRNRSKRKGKDGRKSK